jgi:penicillin-binding protein 1A
MANVYATLADGGWRNSPIAITKVVFADGHADNNWGQPHRVKVLSEAVTAEETSILHQNVLGGTAVKSAINCPTAAKTGTTSELVDAWLDGFNSEYSTAVWMGYPTKRVPMTSVHGEPQQGGALPAVIWHDYMSAVTAGKPCAPLNTTSTESLSYQPFFGKFAATGRTESQENESSHSKQHRKPGSGKHPTSGGGNRETGGGNAGGGGPKASPAPAPSPKAPSAPATPAPAVQGTGGAAP